MLFPSLIFILLFLPIAVTGYFLVSRWNHTASEIFLVSMSVWFYGAGNVRYILFLAGTIAGNYFLIWLMRQGVLKKSMLIAGIAGNLMLLFYCKYCNFFISTLNVLLKKDYLVQNLFIPLGISFITFQQISYLADTYSGTTADQTLLEYIEYIVYFPKIISGPIMLQDTFVPQLRDERRWKPDSDSIAKGLMMFTLGLSKKILLADPLGHAADWGFLNYSSATSADLLVTMAAYTFQIYYDFSGYCDMAAGVSLMLNIVLPINFDSPYRALSFNDFWKRWHITLTGFLRKYIYFPLGGNRKGRACTYRNILIVFLLSGIWHGANYTYILWGLLHGLGCVLDRAIRQSYVKIVSVIRWIVTFLMINLLWLLFRSSSIMQWASMLRRMFTEGNHHVSTDLKKTVIFAETRTLLKLLPFIPGDNDAVPLGLLLLISMILCLIPVNNYRRKYKYNAITAVLTAALLIWNLISLSGETTFLYFGF